VAGKSATTLSRATGEVGAPTGDEAPLVATRHQRWPLFAVGGGVAAAGLSLFLLLRPSHDSGPRPKPVTVAATAVAIAAPPARPDAGSAALVSSKTEAGAASAMAGARPTEKPGGVQPVVGRTHPGTKKVHVAAQPRPPVDNDRKRKEEDEQLKVH